MKVLTIEWKHYDKEGDTCVRCSETGKTVAQVIAAVKEEVARLGIDICFIETGLEASDISESNILLFNGVAMEDIVPEMQVEETDCPSCCTLIGEQTCCRAVRHDDELYEDIPEHLIRLAIELSIEKIKNNKESRMKKIEVLGTGCPKCNSLTAITEEMAESLGIEYTLEKVTDIQKIMGYGVMVTPALVVDGVVKVAGKIPAKEELQKYLTGQEAKGCSCGGKC